MNTFLIADVGACHQGSRERAHALIEAAANAGVSAVKFQFWRDAERLANRRHAPELAETYAQYQLPKDWLEELKQRCDQHSVEFMCTVFLPEDIAFVEPYVKRFKIAAFESADIPFLKAHIQHGKDLLVSCGGIDDTALEKLCGYRRSAMNPGPSIRLLQCTSAYPAKLDELNLGVIRRYALDGFSDHSRPDHTYTGAFAVAAGASIIEAHIRQEDTPKSNPDYPHSMTPKQFKEYAQHIIYVETLLGNDIKMVQDGEEATKQYRVV